MPPSRSFPRALCAALALIAAPWAGAAPPTAAEVIERSAAADWRPLVPADIGVESLSSRNQRAPAQSPEVDLGLNDNPS